MQENACVTHVASFTWCRMEGKGEKKNPPPPGPAKSATDMLMAGKGLVQWNYKLINDKPNCFPPKELWHTATGGSDIWEWARYAWTDSTKQVRQQCI
jgi:hypothetical protein